MIIDVLLREKRVLRVVLSVESISRGRHVIPTIHVADVRTR
jgi:hypothetical protein